MEKELTYAELEELVKEGPLFSSRLVIGARAYDIYLISAHRRNSPECDDYKLYGLFYAVVPLTLGPNGKVTADGGSISQGYMESVGDTYKSTVFLGSGFSLSITPDSLYAHNYGVTEYGATIDGVTELGPRSVAISYDQLRRKQALASNTSFFITVSSGVFNLNTELIPTHNGEGLGLLSPNFKTDISLWKNSISELESAVIDKFFDNRQAFIVWLHSYYPQLNKRLAQSVYGGIKDGEELEVSCESMSLTIDSYTYHDNKLSCTVCYILNFGNTLFNVIEVWYLYPGAAYLTQGTDIQIVWVRERCTKSVMEANTRLYMIKDVFRERSLSLNYNTLDITENLTDYDLIKAGLKD